MKLVHTTTFKLEEFDYEQRPKYSILSHRWGKDEVTLQDLEIGNASAKAGYDKVLRCCEKAKKDGYDYNLDRHLLHRQDQQRRALRGHQLHVSVVL